MIKKTLIILLSTLAATGGPAAAAESENGDFQSKKARKIIEYLNTLGINDPHIKFLIEQADARTKDGYLTLSEEKIPGGNLKLRFEYGNGLGIKRMELQFTPNDSNWQAIARTDRVMVNYNYKF